MTVPPHLTLLKNLMTASSRLWRLVKFREKYGSKYTVFVEGGKQPYEDALNDALADVGKALTEAGVIHVWSENVN